MGYSVSCTFDILYRKQFIFFEQCNMDPILQIMLMNYENEIILKYLIQSNISIYYH